jgi:NAD(P)-dependent dehydrogenase (short-subunit alcohol dehydrogenase family)
VLSFSCHRYADVDLDDPNFERTPYVPYTACGRSKTADALFAVAFDSRHKGRGVRAASVHPGGIRTELMRHSGNDFEARVDEINAMLAARGKAPFEMTTVPQGAATSVWAAVVADADAVGGRHCENCHVGEIVAEEELADPVSEGVFAYALNPPRAEALWAKAEQMVSEKF